MSTITCSIIKYLISQKLYQNLVAIILMWIYDILFLEIWFYPDRCEWGKRTEKTKKTFEKLQLWIFVVPKFHVASNLKKVWWFKKKCLHFVVTWNKVSEEDWTELTTNHSVNLSSFMVILSTVVIILHIFHHLVFINVAISNIEGDALHKLKSSLDDPNEVLQSWNPSFVNPCTWFHVTCNNDNSVIRL